jgi:beta-lactamase class A
LPGSGKITVNWQQGWRGRGLFGGFVVTEYPTLNKVSVDASQVTSVTFSGQAPGTYTFTVTAVGHYADATSTPSVAVRLRARRTLATLAATLSADSAAYGGTIGISFIELYPGGKSWNLNGSRLFIAASTYKLGILMFEAQGIASGTIDPNGTLCYDPSDYEPGLGDVDWSGCYTRDFLAYRVAHYSNNTAAHMLVADLGGGAGLNAYARAHGATNPQLYDPNLVDPNDLAALWRNEYQGHAGGAKAQAWLYPLLTHTDPSHEQGIPAGVPSSAVVVHKIGNYESGNNDAALILNGPSGAYILVVMTDGLSESTANALMRRLAADTWAYESI